MAHSNTVLILIIFIYTSLGIDVDTVVVGAGSSGLTAALRLKQVFFQTCWKF